MTVSSRHVGLRRAQSLLLLLAISYQLLAISSNITAIIIHYQLLLLAIARIRHAEAWASPEVAWAGAYGRWR